MLVLRLQPNVDTRQKQLTAWCSLVLSYCRLNKLYTMTVAEAQEGPLFNNRKLQRILPWWGLAFTLLGELTRLPGTPSGRGWAALREDDCS